ncbi:methionyl-tRNA formyltransferase [uncultured Roseobacter sp.]|uniref:methionyl-tRNA formyltransferase n=1 Tax=uncultured Roseobacter sp. TaxID=114847 RepID=UPI00263049E5|nr:methionyl-tRNA formyltransferase [uncultured Roseobacter sp.]
MRVIFMGTPEFSVPLLDALVTAGHEIPCVYCQPPRPAGRGKNERPSPVHSRALDLDLPVRTPASLRDPEAQAAFRTVNADVAVVVAYGLILPRAILEAPAHGCLNIHASLLPRWRGAAPIHRAIMAGDAQTGVCIMQMEAGLDTGPVLLRQATEIGAEETTSELHDRLSQLGARLIVDALSQINDLVAEPQPEAGVTYAEKIDKAEARVDWTRDAAEVDRLIRGLSPFPGAWTLDGETRIKLLGSRVADGQGAAGTILNGPLRVACGEGAVELTRLQRAGKGVQDADTFLRGWPMPAGKQL